jgi:hypothetical protein
MKVPEITGPRSETTRVSNLLLKADLEGRNERLAGDRLLTRFLSANRKPREYFPVPRETVLEPFTERESVEEQAARSVTIRRWAPEASYSFLRTSFRRFNDHMKKIEASRWFRAGIDGSWSIPGVSGRA